jgi:hypothetical protein
MYVRTAFCAEVPLILTQHISLSFLYFISYFLSQVARGDAVVEALRYKPEGRGFESRLCHWTFSLT